jgi:hypothetical protein
MEIYARCEVRTSPDAEQAVRAMNCGRDARALCAATGIPAHSMTAFARYPHALSLTFLPVIPYKQNKDFFHPAVQAARSRKTAHHD